MKDLQHSVLFSSIVPEDKIRLNLLDKVNKRFNTKYEIKAKKKSDSFVTAQTFIGMLRILNQENLLTSAAYLKVRNKINNCYPFSKVVFN